jgi:hypothetical protein
MIACQDCRFHDDSYGNNCCHASVMLPDPVSGWALETCHNARSEGGKCGREARFFVPSRTSRFRELFCSVNPVTPAHRGANDE